jgi:hypothetical protein
MAARIENDMTLFLVTVILPRIQGGRYFDSIWVVKRHAEERANQLQQELIRSGFKVNLSSGVLNEEWDVRITEAIATDGQLENKEKDVRS